jgi:hypothetical protein
MVATFLVMACLAPVVLIDDPGQSAAPGKKAAGRDYDAFFRSLANGKDVLIRAEMSPQMHWMFDRVAGKLGITTGKITREQFRQYLAEKAANPGARTELQEKLAERRIRLAEIDTERVGVELEIAELRVQLGEGQSPDLSVNPSNTVLDAVMERMRRTEQRVRELERRLADAGIPDKAKNPDPVKPR